MYRIYYNRTAEYPLIWSIDQGTQETEINVKAIKLHRCNLTTGGDPTAPRVSKDVPCVWFEVWHATLVVKDDIALFFHNPDWRVPRIADSE